MKRLLGYFMKGLLVFIPVALTVALVVWVINKFDGLLNLPIPGLGFAITVALITLIGFLASNYFGHKLFTFVDRVFARLPVVKLLYSAIKDLLFAFAGDKKSFEQDEKARHEAHGGDKRQHAVNGRARQDDADGG